MPEVFVAAGSNVEPIANLNRALDVLERCFAPLRCSSAYRNRAVGFEGEDFVNLVIGFETSLDVRAVLEKLHETETACGRARNAPKWAPRRMDLDVLLYGDLVCREPGLELPRPDLVRRAYMLGPMAELAPDLRHPTLGRTMAELWGDFPRDAHPMQPLDPLWRTSQPRA